MKLREVYLVLFLYTASAAIVFHDRPEVLMFFISSAVSTGLMYILISIIGAIKQKVELNKEIGYIKKAPIVEFCEQIVSREQLAKHIMIDGKNRNVYLYRDEIMNDDLISKIQDFLADKDWNVVIIYSN